MIYFTLFYLKDKEYNLPEFRAMDRTTGQKESLQNQDTSVLVQKILEAATLETPELEKADRNEVTTIISQSIRLAQTLEQTAGPPHPRIYPDTDVVWVVSGPGAYSLNLPPFQDKKDRYQHLPWTRRMDRHRLRIGAALVSQVTAERLDKHFQRVTSEDIANNGPVLIYNGTPAENQHILAALSQASVKIPREKVFMFDSYTDSEGIHPIGNTADQVKSLHFPKGSVPRRITIVSHAPHLVRVLYLLDYYRTTPERTIVQPFPIETPKDGKSDYLEIEIKGLLAYIYKYGRAGKTPFPYEL